MIKFILFLSLFLLVSTQECLKCSDDAFFCINGKYAPIEGCGVGDCPCTCKCACTKDIDCKDGRECRPVDDLEGILACFPKGESNSEGNAAEGDKNPDCVENCDLTSQCEMLKSVCPLFPNAKCVTDKCKCSAKLDVNGTEPNCNPGADGEDIDYGFPEYPDLFPGAIPPDGDTNPPPATEENFVKEDEEVEEEEASSSNIWLPILIGVLVLIVLVVAFVAWSKLSKKEASAEKEKDIKEKEPLNAESV